MVLWKDELFGMDTDEVFAYSTKKVVWIRDRWVGAIYYGIIFMVLMWVIGGQIVWRNEQYLMKDVKGLARIWYTHPTKDRCDAANSSCLSDFRPLTELEYCHEFAGVGAGDQKAHCKYQSKVSIATRGVSNNQLFIPTAVEVITERVNCEPSEENGHDCDNEYSADPGSDCLHRGYLCKKRAGMDNQFYYVADIKNFKLRFTSSYERDNIRGTSLMHPAYVGQCESMLRLPNTSRHWVERSYRNQEICPREALLRTKMRCEGGSCTDVRAFNIWEDTGVRKAVEDMNKEVQETAERSGLSRARVGTEETVLLATESFTESQRERQEEAQKEMKEGHQERKQRLRTKGRKSMASFALGNGEDTTPWGEETPSIYGPSHKYDEYSDRWGDVFTVGRLMELAGADLDYDFNMDNWTTRQSGTALEVKAVYNNLYPIISAFGYRDVEYHYEVRELMLPYMTKTELAPVQPEGYPKVRRYYVSYGVLINFEVGGTFGFFNVVYLILMLTTAFALTASATTITDLLGIYVFPRKDNFFHLKYEVSPDFSSTWKCEKCGFHNVQSDSACMGVPKFQSRMDNPPCGAPRPSVAKED